MNEVKSSMFLWRVALVAMVVCAISIPAMSQSANGTFTGTVTDPTGAVIPGAEVTITNISTNSTRTVRTNAAGIYRATELPVGSYRIEASFEGFKTAVSDGVYLNAGVIAKVPFQLEVGAGTETVFVDSTAALVNTEDSRPYITVGDRQVEELPLNGRNVFNLIQLAPGAVNVDGVSLENGENTSVNGLRPNFNGFTINGSSNKGLSGGTNTLPNPDIIAEFQMITLNVSAEYGNSAGSITNVVTKSGSNDFHGSVFWFTRSDSWDATDFFRNANAIPKSPLEFDQFGGHVTGRIIEDKLFFTASVQIEDFLTLSDAQPVTVEDAAWRSAIVAANAADPTIAHVASWLYGNFPSTFVGTPADGGLVGGPNDQSTLDAFVTNGFGGFAGGDFWTYLCPEFLNLAPVFGVSLTDPNAPLAASQQFANLIGVTANDQLALDSAGCSTGPSGTDPLAVTPALISRTARLFNDTVATFPIQTQNNLFDGSEWSARIDWVNGDTDRIFGEFYWQEFQDKGGGAGLEGSRGFLVPLAGDAPNFQLSYVRTFSPTVVNELRAGFLSGRGDFIAELAGVPQASFDDGNIQFGAYNGFPQLFTENIFTYSDHLSITKGDHNMKFGAEFRQNREISEFNVGRPSYYFFDQLFFAIDLPYSEVAGVDPAFATPGNAHLLTNNRDWGNLEMGFFFQDDWKVHPRLTLNIGARYDIFNRHEERFGRETTFIPGPGAVRQANGFFFEEILNANIPAGSPGCDTPTQIATVVLAGVCGPGGFAQTNQLGASDMNNIGPRVGAAWDMFGDGKTALRAGYGVSYEGTLYNPLSNSRWNPPFYSFNLGFNWLLPVFGNDVPIIYGPMALDPITGLPVPTFAPVRLDGLNDNPGAGPFPDPTGTGNIMGWFPSAPNQAFLTGIVFPRGIKDPWIQNWHVGLEQELPYDMVFSANYVATRGNKLFRAENVNRIRGSRLPAGQVANIQGEIIVGQSSGVLNPNYGTMRAWLNESQSWYDSLQASLRKRMSNGLMFNLNYTWSHSLDTGSGWHSGATTANGAAAGDAYTLDVSNQNLDKGNSIFDIRHRLVGNFVYDLPFGNDMDDGIVKGIVSGWQINGIYAWQTGAHWQPYNSLGSSGAYCADIGPDGVYFVGPGLDGIPGNADDVNDDIMTPLVHSNCIWRNTRGDWNLDGLGNDRPDVGAGGTNFHGTQDMWANGWFNSADSPFTASFPTAGPDQGFGTADDVVGTSFFALPCPGCNGNFPRNSLVGPEQINVDLSLFKNVKVNEDMSFQFRFEVFNAMNKANFVLPNSATGGARGNRVNDPNFGRSDSTLIPRQIQFGVKFLF